MIKKFLNVFVICFILIGLCGCKDTTPRIFLSTKPIVEGAFVPMDQFRKMDTINFVLIAPKAFKSDIVRLQLLKKSNLSATYGYTLMLGKDYNVENKYYLTGAFTVYSGGRYELNFFDSDGTKKKTHFPAKTYFPKPKPLASVQFGVRD